MLTPFQYASNNPILNIDLDGLEGIPAPVAEFGYYIEQKTLNAFEVIEENSWKTWHIVMGVGKGLYNVLGSIGPQARVVNINDPSPSLREEFIDPIVNFPAQVQDVYENGTLEEKAQLTTELGFAALTMARSVKGFSLRNFPNSKGISLKNNTPQVGAAFESFAANISKGRVNLSGRAVTNGTFDFVITNSGELKVGFGHSHLSGGAESVKAAGQLSFFKGKVQTITNNSGHYKPTVSEGQGFGELLKQGGVDVSNTKLKVYNSNGSLESTRILK
ncbi:hypothetical protein [Echinicola pacifica]|nr:hypothetical protein [Echinicola pacifica]